MMCVICVEYNAEKLTATEAKRAIREMRMHEADEEALQHYAELENNLDYDIIIRGERQ